MTVALLLYKGPDRGRKRKKKGGEGDLDFEYLKGEKWGDVKCKSVELSHSEWVEKTGRGKKKAFSFVNQSKQR